MIFSSHGFLGTAAIILSSIAPVFAAATCYRQDDHNATESIYTPCNTDAEVSMCYRSQVDANGSPADKKCLPNGLSFNINIAGGYEYWRQSCTDQTWTSPYCLNAFNACGQDGNSNAAVNPCGDDSTSTTWCCGFNNTACCGTSGAITIAAVLGPSSTSSSSSTNPTSTPTSSSTPTSTSTPPSSSEGGVSTGAKAGIGIGAAIGALALLGLIGWMALRARRRRSAPQMGENEVYPVGELDAGRSEGGKGPLYQAVGQHDTAYAPVEMATHER